jgi:hypothetical protein
MHEWKTVQGDGGYDWVGVVTVKAVGSTFGGYSLIGVDLSKGRMIT